ncbi:MAG: restriction endonuclease subunit S [Bdellovibrionales bacterium]|nr:restriction endonuclease subunit S [Bdellovibrionales bacterium]
MPSFQSQQIKLSGIITTPIQTGFQVRGKVQLDSQGNYTLIQVKDTIRSVLYRIKSDNLDKISIPEEKRKFMSKYLVQKNDVLYLSKLNPGAFRYTDFINNTVPMAHFYILRPKTGIIDSDYLCWALNQDFMKPYIKRCLRGTILPFISKDALIDLKIPLPNFTVQKKIISFLKLMAQEKKIQETMDKKKKILINTVLNGLL